VIRGALFVGLSVLAGPSLLASFGCNPEAPQSTGGVDLGETAGSDGESCGRGVAVLMSDYASTNVALLDIDGKTHSGSFLSSGSTEVLLSAPLSGDVVFPNSRMTDELVLLDRFPASVLSFVDVESSEVRTQLSVRTGFDANPQDYLPLDGSRALVSRLEKNRSPGAEPYDEGDDLLVLDTEQGEVLSRVSFSELLEGEGRARPTALVRAGDTVLVSLTGHDATFSDAAPARIAVLDSEELTILDSFEVEGMKNCGGLSLSPSGNRLSVVCSGLADNANGATPLWSGLVVFESVADSWVESHRFASESLGFGPFAYASSFASETQLLSATFGALEGEDQGRPDRLVRIDLDESEVSELLRSSDEVPQVERAFVLGSVLCVPGCEVCFATDAGRRVVHRFETSEAQWSEPSEIRIDSEVELPPRQLGWF